MSRDEILKAIAEQQCRSAIPRHPQKWQEASKRIHVLAELRTGVKPHNARKGE